MLASGPAGAESRLFDPQQGKKIGRIEKFVAADAFKTGTRIGGRTLSVVSVNFAQHFLGVVEKDIPAIALSRRALRYTADDGWLIKALGGEHKAILPFLAYIHHVMETGDAAVGHADGRSNFAYVRSTVDGRLWAVHWTVNHADEWIIGAVHVPHPELDWPAGSRLFTSGRERQEVLPGGSEVRSEH
jgi:hypothetical protein